MTFSSGLFLFLFLPLFLGVYHALPPRSRCVWLLAASWVFYAWWRVDFLLLPVGLSTLTWALGRGMAADRTARPARARAAVAAGTVISLGTLAWFKYAGFGVQSMNALLSVFGLAALPVVQVLLPVGISFSVFKCISYLVDVYRGTVVDPGSWLDTALYIALFPQATSGPIDRFGSLAPQLHTEGRSLAGFSEGASRFMQGFCKKVLIADLVAPLANAAFALQRPTLADAWLGTAAYTMQLYFDFSGYSDMAIGIGRMMGLRFMENFRQPYLSAGITEFWKRWHISLSSWLRDYLYIPLGGNRRGKARTAANLVIVMVLGGLWHGAAFTFIAWGAWHGLLLLIERLRGQSSLMRRAPRPLAVAFTMFLVAIGWVLFRAPSFAGAMRMYAGMIGLRGAGLSPELLWQGGAFALVSLAGAWVGVFLGPWLMKRAGMLPSAWGRAAAGAWLAVLPLFLLAVIRVAGGSSPVFLYGKF